MNDTTLVETCGEPGHAPGPHRHVVFTDLCPHGTPRRYACHGCDFG